MYLSDFKKSRKAELDGLIEKGVFKVVLRSSVPKGQRIYGLRFIDDVKQDPHGQSYDKSRLVGKNYNDKGAKSILITNVPKV